MYTMMDPKLAIWCQQMVLKSVWISPQYKGMIVTI